jgi:LCP family protein required for cell wall assembly
VVLDLRGAIEDAPGGAPFPKGAAGNGPANNREGGSGTLPPGNGQPNPPPAPAVTDLRGSYRRDSYESLRRLGDHGPRRPPRAPRTTPVRFRRRWPRRTLIAVNIASALLLVAAGSAYAYVQWRLDQLNRIHVLGLHTQGSNIAPFTLLVIGSDTRNLGAGGGPQFGSGAEVAGQRSDSIILIRVVPRTRALGLLSIPRDTLVPIPGYGTTRINVAFNSGNPSLLATVLDQDFGIQVNHVVEFNFDTFRQVANAVGGVEQYFPTPARDLYSLLSIPAPGCYNLSGNQALAFVRSREYQYELNGEWHYQLYPESDLARIQRQQSFVRDLARKAKRIAPTNLVELNSVIGGITRNLTIDSGFSNSLLLSLASDFRTANLSAIPSYTYPTVNSTSVPGALDPQTAQGQQLIQQWLNVGQQTAKPSTGKATPPTTVVSPASINVEVQNGSGVAKQAATAAQDLSTIGYHATVAGDASSGSTNTVIYYAPDSLAAARQLQSELAGGSSLVESPALTPTPYNLRLVTGKGFTGLTAGAAALGRSASTSTTTAPPSPPYGGSATVNPASSSFYQGVYIPPGLQPGQVPQTCGE